MTDPELWKHRIGWQSPLITIEEKKCQPNEGQAFKVYVFSAINEDEPGRYYLLSQRLFLVFIFMSMSLLFRGRVKKL